MLEGGEVAINVRGRLRDRAVAVPSGVALQSALIRLDFSRLQFSGDGYTEVEALLANYDMDGDGSYVWIVPDAYLAALSPVGRIWASEGGGFCSHESICVLNTSDRDTRCRLDVFYEDPMRRRTAVDFVVESKRSVHYRLDKLADDDGNPLIAKDQPVAYRLTSFDSRVVVQSSRILTSGCGSEFASFGTSMAWAPSE